MQSLQRHVLNGALLAAALLGLAPGVAHAGEEIKCSKVVCSARDLPAQVRQRCCSGVGTAPRPQGRWRLVLADPEMPTRITYTSQAGARGMWSWVVDNNPSFSGDPDMVFSGKGSFNLESGRAKYNVTVKYSQNIDGERVTGELNHPEEITLGGTADKPTLIIGIHGTASVQASGSEGGGSASTMVSGRLEHRLEAIK